MLPDVLDFANGSITAQVAMNEVRKLAPQGDQPADRQHVHIVVRGSGVKMTLQSPHVKLASTEKP